MAKARRRTRVVRARVPADVAKRIQRLAKAQAKTTSDVVREALELLDRRERRREALEGLIAMVPERTPTKEEYAARFGKH